MATTKKSLADLMSAFDNKAKNDNQGGGSPVWKLFFPFWKADPDTTSIVRFLPDLDEKNPMGFLVENVTHDLWINGKKKTVACGKMYGERCPICELSQHYYDESSPDHDKVLGKKFYRKKSYIGQVLVVDTPIDIEEGTPLVKLIDFGPKIYTQIQTAFKSGDLENPPYEFEGGHNFRINKTKPGEFADYGTSNFAPRATNVSEELIEQVIEQGLYDLAKYRAPHVATDILEGYLAAAQTGGTYQEADAPKPAAKPARQESTHVDSDGDEAEAAAPAPAPTSNKVADRVRARLAQRANGGSDE